MENKLDKLVSVRINLKQLEKLKKALGTDESKTIRACMNCTEFVIQGFFGGEVTNIFRREKKDETQDLYKQL